MLTITMKLRLSINVAVPDSKTGFDRINLTNIGVAINDYREIPLL